MLEINVKIDLQSNKNFIKVKGENIYKQVKKCKFDFFETKSLFNYQKVYGFYKETCNRVNTEYKISEWSCIGKNQKILFNEDKQNFEFVSLKNSPNLFVWSKKPISKNKKESISININHNALQNNQIKFGLINLDVISNEDNYDKYKVLQFANNNNFFCLDFYNINSPNKFNEDEFNENKIYRKKDNDFAKYKFPTTTKKFYLLNDNQLEIYYNHNNKWNSFKFVDLIKKDCYFFFEISGQDNKLILNNIYHETYQKTGIKYIL